LIIGGIVPESQFYKSDTEAVFSAEGILSGVCVYIPPGAGGAEVEGIRERDVEGVSVIVSTPGCPLDDSLTRTN
jgi:hypothetical protein